MARYIIAAGLLCVSLLFLRELRLLPDGMLHLYVFDVGQGDSLFLVTPSGAQILIDGGPDLRTLEHVKSVMPFFDRTIDLVVLTHPDADHITALPDVLDRYTVRAVMMTNDDHPSGRYALLRDAIARSGAQVITPDPSVDLKFDDGVVLDTVWPTQEFTGSSNNRSIVLRVLYKNHAALLTGDIETPAETAMMKTGADIHADILKVPHHGSHTSSSTGFLLAVDPALALISVGMDNRFGHPHQDIIERYRALGIPKKTTAEFGVISLEF